MLLLRYATPIYLPGKIWIALLPKNGENFYSKTDGGSLERCSHPLNFVEEDKLPLLMKGIISETKLKLKDWTDVRAQTTDGLTESEALVKNPDMSVVKYAALDDKF